MANILPILLSLFILQTSSKAAPSDGVAISKISEEDPKLDSVPTGVADQSIIENDSENNQRQKRFYDYGGGYAYSEPRLPTSFPYPISTHYSKRDQSRDTGVYGAEDVFSQIFRRLQQIVSDIRRYPQSVPQQSSIATFIPLLYIPQVGCGCTSTPTSTGTGTGTATGTGTGTSTSEIPSTQINGNGQPQPTSDTNLPDFPNRVLDIDDNRRNWGIVVNKTEQESNPIVEGDGNRPISFDPVIPQTPLDVPVPPVEHGSVQAGAPPQPIPTTTFTPITSRPMAERPNTLRDPPGSSKVPAIAPTLCDTAVISCCLRSQVTTNCFAQQGCPDPSIYGKPCDPIVVLNVVKKVQHYLEQRSS